MRHLRALQPPVLQRHPAGLQLVLIAGDLTRPLVGGDFLVLLVVNRQLLEIVDVVYDHVAFRADNHSLTVGPPEHGRRQRRHPAVLINERQIVLLIEMLTRVGARCLHAKQLIAEHHGCKIQRIYAKIQKRASRQRGIHHPVLALHVIAEVRRQENRLADDAARQNLLHRPHERHISRPDGLGDEDVFLLCQAEQLFCLHLIDRKGLLHKARFPIGNAQLRVLKMLRMRRRDIDKIDLPVL